jgi:hypothetical protein
VDRLGTILWTSIFLGASGAGCSSLPESLGGEPEDLGIEPPEVQDILQSADRYQSKGFLREAIETVEKGLVDYPRASGLRVRLAELRSQRQVCFVSDWNEVDAFCQQKSPASAVVVLRRIERYGDREMVQRARERIDQIRVQNPGI